MNLHSICPIQQSNYRVALAHLSQGIPGLSPCMCAAECLAFGSSNKVQREKGKTETVPDCEVLYFQIGLSLLLFYFAHGFFGSRRHFFIMMFNVPGISQVYNRLSNMFEVEERIP